MKSIVFDTGPIISFALNNLLWTFKQLKIEYGGEFFVTPAIRSELIDRPMQSKKFKFEAHQVSKLFREDVFKVYKDSKVASLAKELSDLSNSCFVAHNHPITIVHEGEMEAISCALLNNSDALVIDERTTRYLIEEPGRIHDRLEKKLHTHILVDKSKINKVKARLKGINVIRSIELISIAFDMGMLDNYLIKDRKELLDGLLWGMKLNGCAVSEDEINIIERKLLSR